MIELAIIQFLDTLFILHHIQLKMITLEPNCSPLLNISGSANKILERSGDLFRLVRCL